MIARLIFDVPGYMRRDRRDMFDDWGSTLRDGCLMIRDCCSMAVAR